MYITFDVAISFGYVSWFLFGIYIEMELWVIQCAVFSFRR